MPEDEQPIPVFPTARIPEETKRIMREDVELIEHFKNHRKRFDNQMLRGAKMWNMIADPAPRDDISNIYIGYVRMVASVAIAAMNEGRPEFGFRPGGKLDRAKIPIWEAGIDHIMNMSNFDARQNFFLTDHTVLGNAFYEVVPQVPMRKVRFPKGDNKFEEVMKRDWRRPKVEIRHRSPFEVWLDPSAATTDDVRETYDEQYITRKEFDRDYKHAILPDGRKKYINTDMVRHDFTVGFSDDGNLMYRNSEIPKKIIIGKRQSEEGDILRIYANGVMIMDGTLQIKELADGTRTAGMNVLGEHSFCIGGNEHQYDSNYRTHSLYSMGLPFA
ncbi:hypothetical protein IID24_05805, partial [Patescibacteria group bacterium]|nr:hypothetical protein [Patescibacteria group bacterium]